MKNHIPKEIQNLITAFARGRAHLWNWFYGVKYKIALWKFRHNTIVITFLIALLLGVNAYFYPVLLEKLQPFFSDNQTRLENLQSLFRTLGTALIGATAIAFTLIMFAMQVNVERMPHGLFRKFSRDKQLLGAFGATFSFAILIACASLIPNSSWVTIAILGTVWGTVLIFVLFLFSYLRALLLINPTKQLNLVVEDALNEMRIWVKRAKRARPLFETSGDQGDERRSTHDLPLTSYLQLHPFWTDISKRAIQHAITFARNYAEKGDHEVSRTALSAIVVINKAYVEAKGKTFFESNPIFENSYSTDGFINNTLEHLRQNVRIGVTRGDEQQIEQTFQAMENLVQIYADIDYSNKHGSKEHANLATGYLSDAVIGVAPHNMADVLMEGVRLMGQSAMLIIGKSDPNDIVPLSEKIGLVACLGAAKEDYRPVTKIAVEQIALLTLSLLQLKDRDISFAAGKLKKNMLMITNLFLSIPEPPHSNIHSTFLGPYYSSTSSEALGDRLRRLVNNLLEADASDETAKTIIRNITIWAEEIIKTEKELLLLAIEKRSHFTFDIIHWLTHISKLLLALSNAPACGEHAKEELQKHALWLISTLPWVPKDKEAVAFVENLQLIENVLFEVVLDGHLKDCSNFSDKVRGLLLGWTFKAGSHETGWRTLEMSLYGLATLVLRMDSPAEIKNLKFEINKRLSESNTPNQEIRDRTARNIRRRAATLFRRGHWSSSIEIEMDKTDHDKMRPLLEELANLLSPNTKDDPVNLGFI